MVEDAEEDEKNQAILNGPCPSMTEDYQGFLQYQKAKWKVQQAGRERRRRLFGANSEFTKIYCGRNVPEKS